MNERIKELAKQARYDSLYEKYYLQEVHKREITPTEYQNIYDKKFAELIVKECVDCLKPLSINHSMVGAAQDTIREHFGVEE